MLQDLIHLFIERLDFFLDLVLQHLIISGTSIILAAFLGLIIGILISEYRRYSTYIISIINIAYTIPSISLLGLFIPILGIGNTNAIVVLTIYALLPMVRNTYAGIVDIDPKIIEASVGMGSTKLQTLLLVKLPLAVPIIVAGLRNTIVMTISLAGIASFIGAGGLGVAIYRGITTNNMHLTIIGSLLIALLAIILDLLTGLVETIIKKKRRIHYDHSL